jgi:phosphoserine phosphatase
MSSGAPVRCDDSSPPYGTLIFDCDSTLASIEGIDELAGARKAEISRLTERAMAGEVPLEAVYAKRLEMLRPDRTAIDELGRLYVATALPRARELFAALRALDKRTCIVSGGLRQAIFALSAELGIPDDDVFAVDVFHHRDGSYAGFDEESPLTTRRGKLEVVRALAKADRRGGVAFVGDGATDLEAAPAARRFVAFGGVVRRPEVFARAAVTCERADLAALLPLLCANDEIDALGRDPRHLPLIHAARRGD